MKYGKSQSFRSWKQQYATIIEAVGAFTGISSQSTFLLIYKVTRFSPILSTRVNELPLGIYFGGCLYFGGYEEENLSNQYREQDEGTIELIDGADFETHKVTDCNYHLLLGHTPDSFGLVVGELKLSDTIAIAHLKFLFVEMFALIGKAVEGNVPTVVATIKRQFLNFHLENNVDFKEGSIGRTQG